MPDRWPRLRRPSASAPEAAGDAGFTLVEILVAIALIAVVMTAMTTFFVSSVAVTSQQRARQAAIQVADDAVEAVRSLSSTTVTTDRDQVSTNLQWTNPVTGVAPYLTDSVPTWDSKAAYPKGATAPLPTSPVSVSVNGQAYAKHWYVGSCWQPATGTTCGTARTSGDIPFTRVVVAVTWPGKNCTGRCAYVTSTLLTAVGTDPIFNPAETAKPPRPNNPGAQQNEVSAPITPFQLTATDGAPPLTWSGSNLPPGIVVASDGTVSGTPTSTGTWNSVTVTVTDAFGLTGTAGFSWTIVPGPSVTNPGSQVTAVDNPVSLTLTRTNGTSPFTWSAVAGPWGATGLPPGLSIDPATGVISGTPTTVGAAKAVTVKVTDKLGVSGTTTFNWTISALQAQVPSVPASTVGGIATVQLTATGSSGTLTWSATGLPAGLTMNSAGRITGTFSSGTRYVVTATVTDGTGASDQVTWVWAVAHVLSTTLRVTAPTADRTDTTGQTVSFTAQYAGGSGSGYSWTASGLPPGITLGSGGVVSGKLTAAGSYVVTLTVRDGSAKTATVMFTWTVQ